MVALGRIRSGRNRPEVLERPAKRAASRPLSSPATGSGLRALALFAPIRSAASVGIPRVRWNPPPPAPTAGDLGRAGLLDEVADSAEGFSGRELAKLMTAVQARSNGTERDRTGAPSRTDCPNRACISQAEQSAQNVRGRGRSRRAASCILRPASCILQPSWSAAWLGMAWPIAALPPLHRGCSALASRLVRSSIAAFSALASRLFRPRLARSLSAAWDSPVPIWA